MIAITDGRTNADLLNDAYTVRDKLSEDTTVKNQSEHNSSELAMLRDFAGALDDALLDFAIRLQRRLPCTTSDGA